VAESKVPEAADFLAEAKVRLARAFIAALGADRGEEALAEAMAYAWANRDALAAMANPMGYLYRVGQSRTRAKKPREGVFPAPARVGMPEIEPELVDAVNALPERQRVCTLLVHAYDWTQAEVAELLGISASSVHRHIERGLAALRQRMGRIDD
jgi:RNA polymerase sigma factor (sigma-70 family)